MNHASAPLLHLQQVLGNQAMQRLLRARVIQAKLTINAPGDEYEQEADRIAEAVMHAQENAPVPRLAGAAGNTAPLRRKCSQCEEEEQHLQTKSISGVQRCSCNSGSGGHQCESCKAESLQREPDSHNSDGNEAAPPIVDEVLSSSGQLLDAATRAFMEPRFGHDFSGVQVHTDSQAAASARSVNALAYTVGKHVVFGEGQYAPSSRAGQQLLAHELTHVVQQRGATSSIQKRTGIAPAGSLLEQEADRTGEAVVSDKPVNISGHVPVLMAQRQRADERQQLSRPVSGGHIEVVRTLENRGCRREPRSERTRPGDILFFDQQAAAFGIRYQYCRGNARVEMETAGRYAQLRDQAQRLLDNVTSGTGSGDLLTQISQAARQSRLRADVSVGVTVSGTLRAELRGSTEQGLPGTSREYQVDGLLRLTPGGWALEIGARYRHVADELGGITVDSLQFTPRFEVGPVQVGATVDVEHQAGGGPASTTTTVRGSVSVRTGDRTGIIFSGSSESGGTFSVSFGTIDRIPQVESVDCYDCVCPPPLPHYACTTVTDAHPGPPTQTAGHEVVELHFAYDSTSPADQPTYDQAVQRIVSLISQHYAVQSIDGYASPEASVDYNHSLAQRRADQALASISSALHASPDAPAPALPPAHGVGELLGEGPGREARNRELIHTIGDLLANLSEDEQLRRFGIDPATATPDVRADVRARIEAFRSGRQGTRVLNERGRWEQIFPYLRRADVTLDRPEIPGPMVPESRVPGSCDDATLRWARENFPPLPREDRYPSLLGMC